MSIKSKLEKTNDKINDSNNKLLAIKNAFLRPLPEYSGNIPPSTGNGNIPDGYIKPNGTKDVTSNGVHNVESYKYVNVNVPSDGIDGVTLEDEDLTIDNNYAVYIENAYDVYINGDETSTFVNGNDIDIQINGTAFVSVNGNNASVEAVNLTPENIKNGVSILGVTGSYVATGGTGTSKPSTVTLTVGDVITYPPEPVHGMAWFIVKNTGSKNQYELYATLYEWGYWENDKYYAVKQNGTELEGSYNYPYMLYTLSIDTPNGEWQFSGSGTASTKASSYSPKASNMDIYTWTNLVTKTTNIYFTKNSD